MPTEAMPWTPYSAPPPPPCRYPPYPIPIRRAPRARPDADDRPLLPTYHPLELAVVSTYRVRPSDVESVFSRFEWIATRLDAHEIITGDTDGWLGPLHAVRDEELAIILGSLHATCRVLSVPFNPRPLANPEAGIRHARALLTQCEDASRSLLLTLMSTDTETVQ